jgi:hypothetical protein
MKSATRKQKLIVAGLLHFAVLGVIACNGHTKTTERAQTTGTPIAAATLQLTNVIAPLLQKESRFDHARKEHKSMSCNQCHRRNEGDPTNPIPQRPYHDACVNCHAQENFLKASSQGPLCVVCHGKGTLMNALEKVEITDFPKSLDQFGLKRFSHQTHLDPSRTPSGSSPLRCDDCHRFDNRMITASFPRHEECYGCHVHSAGQKLSACGDCHVDLGSAMKFEKHPGAASSQYNFKHSAHLNQPSIKSNCAVCHKIDERQARLQDVGARSDIVRGVVTQGQRHQSACWNCHQQSREPVCAKCHLNGFPTQLSKVRSPQFRPMALN